MRQSVLIAKDENQKEGCCLKVCNCLDLNKFQKYFNVTNQQVKSRILAALIFFKGGFFEPEDQ